MKQEATGLGKVFDGLKGAGSGLLDGLGKLGLAGLGIDTLAGAARGLGDALGVGLNSEMENTRAQLLAFTKSATETDKILADLKQEAKTTPFAFRELANATAALLPTSKTANVGLENLVDTAQMLAALNPAEGLEGAAFSLREAMSGDFVSIIERFNLPKQRLMELKEAGVPALAAIKKALFEMGVDASLVTSMGETMTGKWSTFLDTIDSIKQKAGEGLFDALKGGLTGLQTILDENMPALEGFAAGLGGLIGQGATLAVQGLLKLGETVGPILAKLPEFGEALRQALGFFVSGAGDIEMFRGVLNSLIGPAGAQGVIEVFTNLSGFVRETVVPMVQSFGGIVGKVLNGDLGGALEAAGRHVATFGPKLIATLADWGQRFLQWVEPMIPPLLAELGKLGAQVLGWVAQQAPPLLATFANEWVPAVIDWVLKAGEDIGPKLASFLEALLAWVIREGPGLAKTFLAEWVPAAILWVAEATEKIAPKLVEFLGGIGTWVQTRGIPLMQAATLALGQGIIDGIVEGVRSFGPRIGQALSGAAEAAVAEAKRQLGIRSPSRVARDEIGIPLVQGVIQGIEVKGPALDNALSRTLEGAVEKGTRTARGTGRDLSELLGGSRMWRATRQTADLGDGLERVLDNLVGINLQLPQLSNNLGALPALPPAPGWGLFPTPAMAGAGGVGSPTINATVTVDARGLTPQQGSTLVMDGLVGAAHRLVTGRSF